MSCTTCKLSCMHCVDTSPKVVYRGRGDRCSGFPPPDRETGAGAHRRYRGQGGGGRGTRPPPTVSNCFLLLPTVSISLESQLYLWTTDSAIITTFNTFPRNPSAHRLLEIMHVGFQRNTQKKNPNLVKFNSPRP